MPLVTGLQKLEAISLAAVAGQVGLLIAPVVQRRRGLRTVPADVAGIPTVSSVGAGAGSRHDARRRTVWPSRP
ncbi:MAG: hypothetical protein JO262_20805 [Solirubrobacterales bacterium]|nr:hypothetical protein [Solirubrobacterales bacterium]